MRNFDKNIGKIKILVFAANPVRGAQLQLDEEIRLIDQKIRLTEYRDSLELIPKLAVRPDDLLQELNRYKPQIVHFSAHGQPTGAIALVGREGLSQYVSPQAIRALFTTLKDNLRLVMLNACYSYIQAEAITEVIDCAIGMSNTIGDQAAIVFAASFYRAIGFGRTIREAFDQGIAALMLQGIPEESTPKLHVRRGVDPSSIVILNPEEIFSDQESRRLLQSAQSALTLGDYVSAGKNIEKVLEMADHMQSGKVAQARFLQALVALEGKRPFNQKLSVMRSIENFLHLAIAAHPSFSYLLLLAMCKRDFARNGYPHYLGEAHELILKVGEMSQTSQDRENLELLAICQPNLTNDFLRMIS